MTHTTTTMGTALQERFDAELKEMRTARTNLQNLVNSRAQYMTQLNENEMVKKELELLEEDADVFKLIGPTLIKQEKSEAISNVNKRIDYINGELKRLDTAIKELEQKIEDKRLKILEMQQQALQQQPRSK